MVVGLLSVVAACSSLPSAGRRAAVGAGLAAAGLGPSLPHAAWANDAGAAKFASGYVTPPLPAVVIAELKASLYEPLDAALSKEDWGAVGAFYLPTATVVDGTTKGAKVSFVQGSEARSLFAGRGLSRPSLLVTNFVLEGEFRDIAHVSYNFAASGAKPYQGLQRVVRSADGKWLIDEDIYPLDSGKVYSMVVPKRLPGKVYMQLDPSLRLS